LAGEKSKGVGWRRGRKEEKMATGGKWECKELLDVSAFVFLLSSICPSSHSFPGVVHTGRPLPLDFSIHIFGAHTVFL
jgi:hypothetical protein